MTKMDNIERKTLAFHLTFSAANGVAAGVLMSLQEVIAKKALGATPGQVTLLFMSVYLARTLSVFFTPMMQRLKSYRGILFAAAFVRLLSAVSVYFVHNPWWFILALWVFQLPYSVINPAQNYILSKNYTSARRGTLFGYAVSTTNLFALVASYAAGSMLDINQQYFRLIIPAIGLLSAMGVAIFAMVPVPQRANIRTVSNPLSNMFKILAQNRDFWRFERNFFLYGFGFLLIGPVVPLFLVDVLNMSYREVSLARGVIAMSVQILFAPFSGKIHDKHSPFHFAGMSMATLAFFPLMLYVSGFVGKLLAYGAFVVRSLGMTGVGIVWNLGSIFFADKDNEATYQAIHLTMVGVRGLTAPILGYIALTLLGYTNTFLVSAGILFLASLIMYLDGRRISQPTSP